MTIGDEDHICVHCGDNDHEPGCPDGAIVARIAEDYARNGVAALNRIVRRKPRSADNANPWFSHKLENNPNNPSNPEN